MVRISIVVPVYNISEKDLRNCIESLATQSFMDIEIILVDDGSKDSTGKICDMYTLLDNRIIVIHQKNQGVSVARNTGLMIAKGDYILFVDADDYIEKDACRMLYEKAIVTKDDVILFMYIPISKTENKKTYQISADDSIFSLNDELEKMKLSIISLVEPYKNICLGSPWGKLFKTEFLIRNNVFYIA